MNVKMKDCQQVVINNLKHTQEDTCPVCDSPFLKDQKVVLQFSKYPKDLTEVEERNLELVHQHCINRRAKHKRQERAKELRKQGKGVREIADIMKLSLTSVYLYLRDFREPISKKPENEESKFGKGFIFFEPSSQVPPILEDDPLSGEDDIPPEIRRERSKPKDDDIPF